MIASLSQKHPLFDPSSLYNQMRGTICVENKMRGYWYWLRVQPDRAVNPLPPTEPRPERELGELTRRLAADHGSKCSVLDALRVHSWLISEGEREGSMRAIADTAEVLLVREEDGTRTLALLLEGQPHDWFPGVTRCRAFLLEAAVLPRLASALRIKGEASPDRILRQAFQRDTVTKNYEVARLICALPELEGEMLPDRGFKVRFCRLPVPDGSDPFPPR